MAAAGESQTVSEYIAHHLTNLDLWRSCRAGFARVGEDGAIATIGDGGAWANGSRRHREASAMGFSAIHVDSMLWSRTVWA